MIKVVPDILAFLTVGSDVFLAAVVVFFILEKLAAGKLYSRLAKYFSSRAYFLSFVVSLTATLGSLYFSEIAKFTPCLLCWYQRILMYPQALLLYISILRDEKILIPYLRIFNIIGAAIAGYHYYIQVSPRSSFLPCSVGGQVSCTKTYTLYFGYITIPMMALTAFLLNLVLLHLAAARHRSQRSGAGRLLKKG
ncbi:disulfide bond formation protein B [Candidatus Roizmanbacteria bacterium]|nr:disulfide bond formation protein B [Candidatus Roizmanbacteria bacterium]